MNIHEHGTKFVRCTRDITLWSSSVGQGAVPYSSTCLMHHLSFNNTAQATWAHGYRSRSTDIIGLDITL